MTVTETTSTAGHYRVFSSSNSTLATVLTEVLNELEAHNIPLNQTQFVFQHDDSADLFVFMAVCRR